MAQDTTHSFGKWRSMLWPVHTYELKKLLPMLLMMFFILFNYTILRDAKDALIVTAPGGGAEVIPFLKVWGVVPLAMIFMVIFAKLSNMFSKPTVFYIVVGFFLAFFVLFAVAIYPFRESLHPNATADYLLTVLPQGLAGFVAMLRNWTYSLFYIMAELWGSVVVSLLFWGFANDITRVTEAKRFYPLFGLGGNVALLFSGPTIIAVSKMYNHLAPAEAWGFTLKYLMLIVLLIGIALMGVYWWMQKNVLTDPRFYDPSETKKVKKSKPKMSIVESAKYLMTSKYLGCIALLVIGYGISINLVEVSWKAQVKLQYPNSNDYIGFMGMFSSITGTVTILMMLFVGGNVMRFFGWKTAALITPVTLLITGVGFFSFIIFRENLAGLVYALGSTPLMLAVIFGMAQNIASKSAKYSLFDPTKEMAYIPLDDESKVKGKAAIDVVGARLGKSGGSLLQQVLLGFLGTVGAMTPYIGIILFIIIGLWIIAVKSLNKQFLTKSAESEKTASAEKQA